MKEWYKSKVLWFNLLALLVAVTTGFGFDEFEVDPLVSMIAGGIVALINVFLRLMTGQALLVGQYAVVPDRGVPALKEWYKSKVLWFNVLALLVAVATGFGFGELEIDPLVPAIAGGIVALINLILRLMTTKRLVPWRLMATKQ